MSKLALRCAKVYTIILMHLLITVLHEYLIVCLYEIVQSTAHLITCQNSKVQLHYTKVTIYRSAVGRTFMNYLVL